MRLLNLTPETYYDLSAPFNPTMILYQCSIYLKILCIFVQDPLVGLKLKIVVCYSIMLQQLFIFRMLYTYSQNKESQKKNCKILWKICNRYLHINLNIILSINYYQPVIIFTNSRSIHNIHNNRGQCFIYFENFKSGSVYRA